MVWRRRDPNQLKKSGLTINSLLEAQFKYEKLVPQQLDHQSGPKKNGVMRNQTRFFK